MTLAHDERNILGHAVIPPYLENMLHQLRLSVKRLPRNIAGLKGIVLKRNESQILQVAAALQILDEPAHPGGAALCIGPYADVFVHAFKDRSAKFEFGIDFVNRVRPLN